MTRRRAVIPWTWSKRLVDVGPKGGMLLTLLAMTRWMAPEDGHCYMSQETLAKVTGQSLRTVNRNIRAAYNQGWLHIEKKPREGKKKYYRNEYLTTVPAWVRLTEKDEELADNLHSWAGDVGEDYKDAPTADDRRPQNHTPNDPNHTPFETEPHAISDINHTPLELHEVTTEVTNEVPMIEGAPDGARLPKDSHWGHSETQEQPSVAHSTSDGLAGEAGAKPTNGAVINPTSVIKAKLEKLIAEKGLDAEKLTGNWGH